MENRKRRRMRGSVFSRTMLMLLVLSLVTVLAMFFFVNYIVSQNQKARFRTMHEDQLKQVAVYLDGQISAVQQDNAQLLHGTDAVSLMVNPRKKSSDVSYHVVSALQNSTEQNQMVRRAFLYLPTTGEVYSSAGSAVDLSESNNRMDIEQYLEVRENGRTPGAECEHRLLFRNRRLYVVTDFCVPVFLGALFQEIDLELINTRIQSSSGLSPESFFVLGASGGIILAESEEQEALKQALKDGNVTDISADSGEERSDYLIYASQENSLTYGLRYNQDINFNEIYWQKDREGNPAYMLALTGGIQKFLLNTQSDDRQAVVVTPKEEFRKLLAQAVEKPKLPFVVGFSLDSSGVITLHVQTYDILRGPVGDHCNTIELTSIRSLFDIQTIERAYEHG